MKKISLFLFHYFYFSSLILFANDDLTIKTAGAYNSSDNIYIGTSNKNQIIPLVFLNYNNFYIEGFNLGYILNNNNDSKISVEIGSEFLGYKNTDSIYLSSLVSKNSSLDFILNYKLYFSNNLELNTKLYTDISNTYNGYGFESSLKKYIVKNNNYSLSLFISLNFFNNDKSNYYYGVKEKEKSKYFDAYTLSNSLNKSFGIEYIYQFKKNWSFFTNGEITYLDNDIKNSPIVNTNKQKNILLGVLYEW